MLNEKLLNSLRLAVAGGGDQPFPLSLSADLTVDIYPHSVVNERGDCFFMAACGGIKSLYVVATDARSTSLGMFHGKSLDSPETIKCCPLDHANAEAMRTLFPFTRPVLIGLEDSIGLGDRLGLANPAHLRAVRGSNMRVILAQQSVRELERTQRTPEEVMDAASWAVFQEGFRDGFGSDADHLKTTEDIDRLMAAGFTMFTFDPSAHVDNHAAGLTAAQLEARARDLDWSALEDSFDGCLSRYLNKSFTPSAGFTLRPSREELLRGLVKYGQAIAHSAMMYRHILKQHPGKPFEIELSVDETDTPTTPFEHFLIASELRRLGVQIVSLAPRFIGDFEKGIDYKGDLQAFRREYIRHLDIAQFLGPYKLSIHSGSDKFGVYATIASIGRGGVHVKTAGTSYLEALRAIAVVNPALFREILAFSIPLYEVEKHSYHVSASLDHVPAPESCPDERLPKLLDENDTRQVLHVTFGKVLTTKDEAGRYLFRERLLQCLEEHEEQHYAFVERHIRKHLKPFQNVK